MSPVTEITNGVGAILVNQNGEILLQLRSLDAPKNPGLIGTFGGRAEPGESTFQTLAWELMEELELDISSNGKPAKFITSFESKNKTVEFNVLYLISDIDDTKLVLHEGDAIVKVKKLTDIPDSAKWYGLRIVTDKMIDDLL